MIIETKQEGNKVTLMLEGRLDSNTSTMLQDKIGEAFKSGTEIVLDFEKIAFISSAGLRVLLIGHKTASSKNGSMTMTNVSDQVMKVLENVGFAKFLTFA